MRATEEDQRPKRLAKPGEDDICVEQVEMSFALPVYVTQKQQYKLHSLINEICSAPVNQLDGWVHWAAESGAKPQWSKADAAVLGIAADEDAPEVGEPTFDSSILYFASAAREAHAGELARKEEFRRRFLVWTREPESQTWVGRLRDDLSTALFLADVSDSGVVTLTGAFVPDANETANTYTTLEAAKAAAEEWLVTWCRGGAS